MTPQPPNHQSDTHPWSHSGWLHGLAQTGNSIAKILLGKATHYIFQLVAVHIFSDHTPYVNGGIFYFYIRENICCGVPISSPSEHAYGLGVKDLDINIIDVFFFFQFSIDAFTLAPQAKSGVTLRYNGTAKYFGKRIGIG